MADVPPRHPRDSAAATAIRNAWPPGRSFLQMRFRAYRAVRTSGGIARGSGLMPQRDSQQNRRRSQPARRNARNRGWYPRERRRDRAGYEASAPPRHPSHIPSACKSSRYRQRHQGARGAPVDPRPQQIGASAKIARPLLASRPVNSCPQKIRCHEKR